MKLYYSLYTFLAAAFLMTACSEDILSDKISQESDGTLHLRVSVCDFIEDSGTKAADNGSELAFEQGDRVGVLILREGEPVGTNNLPYVYDGAAWKFDTQTAQAENTGKQAWSETEIATFIVYYPYDAAADGIYDIEGLKATFQPEPDQQTEEAYRRSDLMACTATVSNLVLDVRLSHLYASFSLLPSVEYTLTDGKNTRIQGLLEQINISVGDQSNLMPFKAEDGSFRYILPDGFSGDIRWFYSCGTATYGGSRTLDKVEPNTRYSQVDCMDGGEYGYDKAKLGDYYCTTDNGSVGYLLPTEAAYLLDEHHCVGVVFQTDLSRIGDAEKEALGGQAHALALAVRNSPCYGGYREANWWGQYGYIEEGLKDCTTYADLYADLSGLYNTESILTTRAAEIDELGLYQAFKAVRDWRNTEPLPDNTTDWFLPSAGQWWDVLQIMGKAPALADPAEQTNTEYPYDWIEQGDVVPNLNSWLSGLEAGDKDEFATIATRYDISNEGYWTSSEYSYIYAIKWYYIEDEGILGMSNVSKHYGANVRCAFAF